MTITYKANPGGPTIGTCGGKSLEDSSLLPVQLPKDMATMERHCEDRPLDLEPYRDSQGNAYGFAFGLNWSGPIRDARTERYAKI